MTSLSVSRPLVQSDLSGNILITVPITCLGPPVSTVVRIYIYEGSWLPTHGDLLANYSQNVSFAQGETKNVVFPHTETATNQERRDVGVDVVVDNEVVAGHEFDDVYYVETIPAVWEVVQDTQYHWYYTYEGKAERCTFEFKLTPEQIPGTEWLGQKIVDTVADQLKKDNGKLLSIKVWRDTSPTMWTNYKVEILSSASPLAWNLIIIAVLAIMFVVAVYFTIKLIENVFFKPKALSEEIKKTWSRETLISAIGDFEVKLERTPTPAAELEKKSDQELRDYADKMAEEIVPPTPSWVKWALIGGAAVVGTIVVVSLAKGQAKEK